MKKETNSRISETESNVNERGWWAVLPGMALIICFGLLGVGCGPTFDATCSKDDTDFDAFFEKFNIANPRFTFVYPGNPELLPSKLFYFSKGDIASQTGPDAKRISFGFDGANQELREPDAPDNCSFANMDDGCYQCDLCVTGLARCNNGLSLGLVDPSFPLITLEDVDKFTREARVLQTFPDPGNACYMRSGSPGNAFVLPDKSAVITLEKKHICGGVSEELAKFETIVVNSPGPVYGKLESFTDNADPTTQRFFYSMRLEGGMLDENFSPDLRITRIRVLEETFNGRTGREDKGDTPAALKRMLPSRILFLPSYEFHDINDNIDEDTNRCYVDASTEDGNFDLFRNCRQNPNMPGLVPHEATPTYMNSPGRRHQTLTWVIEYKVSDGLTGPPDFSMGRPILEFRIEEVQ